MRTSRQGSPHVYKLALLPVEEGNQLSLIQSVSLLSFYFTHSCASLSQQSSSGTAVRTILAGSHTCQLSVDALCSSPFLSLFFPSLYCLDDTFTLAALILDTPYQSSGMISALYGTNLLTRRRMTHGPVLSKEIGNGVGMVARKEVEQDAREKAEGTG